MPTPAPLVPLNDGGAMPGFGYGTAPLHVDDAPETVAIAIEAGYRLIDTAASYDNETGVGRGIAASSADRGELFITTKLRGDDHGAEEARRGLHGSLERLGLEYVDLYLIHWPVPGRSGPGWRELEKLRDRGLTRSVGVSNYGVERLERVVERSNHPPAVNQVQFSPFHYRRALLETCERLGVVLEAYSPLERGGRDLDHPTVAEVASRLGRTTAQVLLRWAVQRGTVVIPKSSRRERIVANARIFDFELGEADMAALDSLDRTGGTGNAR
jgi:2,5-diketo-D-gluconate reductase A